MVVRYAIFPIDVVVIWENFAALNICTYIGLIAKNYIWFILIDDCSSIGDFALDALTIYGKASQFAFSNFRPSFQSDL